MRKTHKDYYFWLKEYEFIRGYVSNRLDITDDAKCAAIKSLDEKIIERKREYRAALKGKWWDNYLYPGTDGKGYGKIVACGGEWDSFWRKIFFEGEHWTEEEIREFIDDNWVSCKLGPYDCTGQRFTWAIDCFNVPSGVVCYIREALDV